MIEKKDRDSIYGEYISKNEQDTEMIATKVAKTLNKNDVIVLTGELGAGKTKFVYGLAKYFGTENKLCSPTFTIVNEYVLDNIKLKKLDVNTDIERIYHFDVYRLQDSNDFIDSVGLEYFDNGLCIIEWGEIIKEIVPKNAIYISIERIDTDDNFRKINIFKNI